MGELHATLAAYSGRGYVVAPAGFGKTHVIAQATSLSSGRQLVLTHTHAGVNALRNKMRGLGVGRQLFHVDTIASWALRLSLSYSKTSRWTIERPANNQQWSALYDACAGLLEHRYIRRVIRASYVGVYVDEYQDCSAAQHLLVLKISRDLPTRVLGDPLQGIFDFGEQETVKWQDVERSFARVGRLDLPYRWMRVGANGLGAWLKNIRSRLEQGGSIDLRLPRPAEVQCLLSGNSDELAHAQRNKCRYFRCDPVHTVVAIHKGIFKSKCHDLARSVSGSFVSIEEVEGKDLFKFINGMQGACAASVRLRSIVEFAATCMTSIRSVVPAGVLRGELVNIGKRTKNPEIARRSNAYLDNQSSARAAEFLRALSGVEDVRVARADLFNRALAVFDKQTLYPELTLVKAAEEYQVAFRHTGRPVGRRRLIGTTLLVKGLEFDHAIVLDATALSRRELYVALTRGSRSLTIMSSAPVLSPES